MKFLLTVLSILLWSATAFATATQPAAHYANGQVWVVWKVDPTVVSGESTYAIYRAPTSFTKTSQATLVGRMFLGECTGQKLVSEVNSAYGSPLLRNFNIPAAGGGTYRALNVDEGVFADTVRANGSFYYAVVPYGQTLVAANEITSTPVNAAFTLEDPPRPHLQIRAASTSGHMVSFYALWVDGDDNDKFGRPDFPIMANAAKRGAGHTFMTVEPSGGLPGAGPWPATVCLHGGDASVLHWLPDRDGSSSIDVEPFDGYVLAFDDDLFRNPGGDGSTTGHFGYAREYDPFTPAFLPPGSTIVNYTQLRYIWVIDWLAAHAGFDAHRISLLGHSNGAQGCMMLMRVFPTKFSAVQLFNCSMQLFDDPGFQVQYGSPTDNFPSSVTDRLGQPVHMVQMARFAEDISPVRDLPFLRIYAGKCDDNNERQWRSYMLDQIRWSDTTGTGAHFYWDRRRHGLEQWEDYWVDASTPARLALQTRRDDVAAIQTKYRNDQSYPAFFNVQSYANHGEPGPGYIGGDQIDSPCGLARDENGNLVENGDEHGTWGGYLDWETNTLVDTPTLWQCRMFLVGAPSGYATVDQSPQAQLTADLTIRRAQHFLLPPGTPYLWAVKTSNLATVLQSGTGTVAADGLVRLNGVTVTRDPNRVVVQVTLVPKLSVARTGSTQITLSSFLLRGFNYQLKRSTNLVSWSDLGPAAPGNDANVDVPRQMTVPAEFFRLNVSGN